MSEQTPADFIRQTLNDNGGSMLAGNLALNCNTSGFKLRAIKRDMKALIISDVIVFEDSGTVVTLKQGTAAQAEGGLTCPSR